MDQTMQLPLSGCDCGGEAVLRHTSDNQYVVGCSFCERKSDAGKIPAEAIADWNEKQYPAGGRYVIESGGDTFGWGNSLHMAMQAFLREMGWLGDWMEARITIERDGFTILDTNNFQLFPFDEWKEKVEDTIREELGVNELDLKPEDQPAGFVKTVVYWQYYYAGVPALESGREIARQLADAGWTY